MQRAMAADGALARDENRRPANGSARTGCWGCHVLCPYMAGIAHKSHPTTPSQGESLFVLLFVQLEHAQHSWICRQDRSSIALAVHINRITLSYSPASSVRLRTSVGGGNCGQLRDLPRAAYSVPGREAEPQEARAHSSDSTQRATPKDKELDWARTFPGEGD